MDNIVLITVDSLRADHVGAYGYGRDTTPNIDELSSSGALFENTFANAPFTRASFPAILTSSSPLMYGGYERLSSQRTIVSEILDANGYLTAGFHSNLFLSSDFGYARGFDTFYDSKPEPSATAKLKQFVRDRLEPESWLFQFLANNVDRAERNFGVNFGSLYTDAAELTDIAIEWIRSNELETPKFLWVHYMDPHHPYVPSEKYQRNFRDETVSRRHSLKIRRKMIEEPDAITSEEQQILLDLYDAEIRYTDDHIGRLVETVRSAWNEPTTVFMTADHGEEFGDHGEFSHHSTFYDEVLHVPLVIDAEGISGEYDELIASIDIPATIAAETEAELPENYYGFDIDTLLRDGSWKRTEVISEVDGGDEGEFSLRTHEWKYIRRPEREELYHLPEDPSERNNVVESYADVATDFRETIAEHERQIEATETDLGTVDIDEATQKRLRDLGYRQ